MRIIYIWIENYRNTIINQGFSLTSDFTFECVLSKNTLTIDIIRKTTQTYGKRFYSPKISSIKAIVGENGVGKTTIIDILSSINSSYSSFEYLVVYEQDDELFFTKSKDFYYTTKILLNKKTNINICDSPKSTIVKYTHASFISPERLFSKDNHIHDLSLRPSESTYSSLLDYKDSIARIKDVHKKVRLNEFISLLETNFLNEHSIEIKFPTKIKLNFDFVSSRIEHDSDLYPYLSKYYEVEKKLHETSNIKKILILSLINTFITESIISPSYRIDIDNSRKNTVLGYGEETISILLKDTHKSTLSEKEIREITSILDKDNVLIDKADFSFILSYINKIDFDTKSNIKFASYTINIESKIPDDLLKILDLELFRKVAYISWYNDFNFSKGQENLLILFSRLYNFFNNNSSQLHNDDFVLLLLDEPDESLHPNWKRNLLNTFINFLNKLCTEFNIKEIQIVITSNSPYFISDLISDDIIKLTNNGIVKIVPLTSKTFGSNIHNLLKDTFFMDDTIGEFAKQKIKAVTKDLIDKSAENIEQEEGRKEEIKFIIDNIGEPIIQRKLQELYNRKFNREKKSYEYEIAELKDKLRKADKSPNSEDIEDIDNIIKKLQSKVDKMKENVNMNN